MKMFSNHLFKSTVRILAVAGLLMAGSLIASAQTAGYDLLQTGNGASADLRNFGLGSVPLQGVPIQASTAIPTPSCIAPRMVRVRCRSTSTLCS